MECEPVDPVIGSDERLRRRVMPPSGLDRTWVRRKGVWRAASYSLRDSPGSSFSRRRYTSAVQLLENLGLQGIDPVGWGVCEVVAAGASRLGFDVVAMPTDDDHGHCEIRAPMGLGRAAWSRLAKVAPMIARMAPDGTVVDDCFEEDWGRAL